MKKTVLSFLIIFLLMMNLSGVEASLQKGKEVLPKNDGWASYGDGTSGGSEASKDHIYTVKSKAEFIQALGGDNETNDNNDTPKIIYIKGIIDLNVNERNEPIGADYYADPGYDFQAYLDAYHPDKWGYEEEVSGPLEEARARSQKNQENEIVLRIGSNTSIIGLGKNAEIRGGSLLLDNVDNVIIRNITFEAPIDFFPQWDPTDGDFGEWNSEYDTISLINGTHHIWVDHNTFTDGRYHDADTGVYFGRIYQQHDGLLDITNGSSYVTASYNVFENHDKVSLIGSSDNRTQDREALKVTLHHNYYKNVTQRLPRVRFGQVHVYNNYYEFNTQSDYSFDYALGVGKESNIYAENNYFKFDSMIDPSKIIKDWKGTTIYENGSVVQRKLWIQKVDLVEAFNASNSIQLTENVNWQPTLYRNIQPTLLIPTVVKLHAGAGK